MIIDLNYECTSVAGLQGDWWIKSKDLYIPRKAVRDAKKFNDLPNATWFAIDCNRIFLIDCDLEQLCSSSRASLQYTRMVS